MAFGVERSRLLRPRLDQLRVCVAGCREISGCDEDEIDGVGRARGMLTAPVDDRVVRGVVRTAGVVRRSRLVRPRTELASSPGAVARLGLVIVRSVHARRVVKTPLRGDAPVEGVSVVGVG
ncbi:MAG TPA: hypothetical protein VND21_01855, partial [Planctomycetota bacterium]|nr:hypothetical protein [Planctomycetota bacterium]